MFWLEAWRAAGLAGCLPSFLRGLRFRSTSRPQSTAEYAASVGSFVAAIGVIVLAINMTTMLLAWIEYNDARIEAAMLFVVVGLGSTTLWITYETQCRIPA